MGRVHPRKELKIRLGQSGRDDNDDDVKTNETTVI